MSSSKLFPVPSEVADIAFTLKNKGFQAYLVGGCVRDILLGIEPKDWDITTDATPEKIISIFPKTFYENEYGTVGVVNENSTDERTKVVEVTPFRLETGYSNQRHPDSVSFSTNLEEDLKRRDFTINALALALNEKSGEMYRGEITDVYKGQEDLRGHIIRTVGQPEDRFSEDALRI